MSKIKVKVECLTCDIQTEKWITIKEELNKDILMNLIEFGNNPKIKIHTFCYECELLTTHLILEIL